MRLTSIKLAGFKSFVDPVTVPFEANMTAIVGPNGCGKSNVIDAVRWVMGESSAKYLRGESMADVIFNGSTGRKPVGQASIELVFDNSAGKLGGPYAGYAEIAVRRVVTRDGQSQYFFNGQKCRRRDISDLFLGTGLGPRSYAIIGQGMISRLIEARPEELRATFEEAAGISRYKERRRETENRMRRTQENLERLDDLREELDRQLERLKRQADAARRYRDLKEREYRLRGELALMRGNALRTQQREQEARVSELETGIERELLSLRESENQLEQARQDHDAMSETLDQHQRAFYDTGAEIARLEQQLEAARARERQLGSDIDSVVRDIAEIDRLGSDDEQRMTRLGERLAELDPERAEAAQTLETLEAQLEEADEVRQNAQQAWQSFDEQDREARFAAERAQGEVQRLERAIGELTDQIARNDSRLAELPEARELESERGECREQLAELDEQREEVERERQTERERQDEAEQAIETASAERERSRARRHTLEGERASLEALIRAALESDDETLTHHLQEHELDGRPVLGEQLEVDEHWAAAADRVLAPWLAARTVTSGASLAPLVALPGGELRLVEETDSRDAPPPGTLAECVRGAPALDEWLGRIRLASSHDEALARRAELAPGESVLTPDGLWLGRHWALRHAGGERHDSVIANRQRRDALDTELAELDEQLAGIDERLDEARQRRTAAGEALETLHQRQRELESQRQPLMAREGQLASRLEHVEARRRELVEERETLTGTLEERREEFEQARMTHSEAMATVEDNADQREQLDARRRDTREQWEALSRQLTPQRETLNQLDMERQRLVTEREGIESQRNRAGDQRARLEEKRELLVAQREEGIEPIEEMKGQLDEYLERRAREEQALNERRDEASELSERMRQLESGRQGHERRIEELRGQLEQRRMDVQALSLKADAQFEQLQEQEHDPEALAAGLAESAEESTWQQELESVGEKIRRLGAINLAAIEEYDQQAERRDYIEGQHRELTEALETLERAIRKIDGETRSRFRQTFDDVNAGFGELFPRVFGGGAAWLTMTGEDLLDTGVAIMARPPGKKNTTIHLLSGGEKALTALSLVFAIFRLNPAPFCMLDEVDAPLDDANVGRYAKLVREMSESVQFIYITHNRLAMEAGDRLMGVTMQEPGVSRLVSVGVEEAAALADA
ncbi:condensin subunit Smc [Kushneria sinocarnis]|uniref:Chromosome partition protein Smc n=1 Tax=Kushneria sinocarnis TaxID=595502 RepID=A0A420WZG4_9GAMM|nr:chromosome segregation protein SMC [Kushneria sinocarnis]RKR06748.1 condensin subunit Smc [Kushneria sinocarnis]